MSAGSRVGLFRYGFNVAVFKGAGIRSEVREELIRVVRNDKMSFEMYWRRWEGIGSREQVVAWLDVTIV